MNRINLPPDYLELLNKFVKVALEIINENNDEMKNFVRMREEHYAEIQPILDSDEFSSDFETYVSIQSKYEEKGINIPFLLGYVRVEYEIGPISVEGEVINIEEDIFLCEEGITIIMKILDLLDANYECKGCLVRSMCQKLDPDMACKKVEDIMDGTYLTSFVKDILTKICEISFNSSMLSL